MTTTIAAIVGALTVASMIVALVVIKRGRRAPDSPSDPRRLLEVLVAHGEITTTEFHEQRAQLGSPPPPGGHSRKDAPADEGSRP